MNRTLVLVSNEIFNKGGISCVVSPIYESYKIKVSLERNFQKYYERRNIQREKDIRNGFWRYNY